MITNKITNIDSLQQSSLKKKLLDFSSRYNNCDMLFYSDFNILTFETYKRSYNSKEIKDVSKIIKNEIKYYLITKGTQYKPYLVSQDAYGDPGYWWYIMEFNNIFDIEDFEEGKTIKIPPVTYLQF